MMSDNLLWIEILNIYGIAEVCIVGTANDTLEYFNDFLLSNPIEIIKKAIIKRNTGRIASPCILLPLVAL